MIELVAIGLALGVVTGIPLGVINVAVVEAAVRDRRLAIGIGVGGGAADLVHAWLAFAGVGALIARDPRAAPALFAITGVVVIAYGVAQWRRRERAAPAVAAAGRSASSSSSSPPSTGAVVSPPRSRAPIFVGAAFGFLLTLPNPGALLAWVLVAGALLPGLEVGEAAIVAVAVGAGSMLWFAALAALAHRGARPRPVSGATDAPRRRRWLRRALAGALIAFGVASLGRAIYLLV